MNLCRWINITERDGGMKCSLCRSATELIVPDVIQTSGNYSVQSVIDMEMQQDKSQKESPPGSESDIVPRLRVIYQYHLLSIFNKPPCQQHIHEDAAK